MTPRLTESPFRVGPALALSVFALTSASFLLSCAAPTFSGWLQREEEREAAERQLRRLLEALGAAVADGVREQSLAVVSGPASANAALAHNSAEPSPSAEAQAHSASADEERVVDEAAGPPEQSMETTAPAAELTPAKLAQLQASLRGGGIEVDETSAQRKVASAARSVVRKALDLLGATPDGLAGRKLQRHEIKRLTKAIEGHMDHWSAAGNEANHALTSWVAARLRGLQDDAGIRPEAADPDSDITRAIRALANHSKVTRPGIVHGLARGHRPRGQSWWEDARTHEDNLRSLAGLEPAGPSKAEFNEDDALRRLIAEVRDGLEGPALVRHVRTLIEQGVSPQETRLVRLCIPFAEDLREAGLNALAKAIEAELEEDERVEESTPPLVPTTWPHFGATEGKTAVIVGGDPRPERVTRLKKAFRFASLDWIDNPTGAGRGVDSLVQRMHNGTVDVVIVLRAFSSHKVSDKVFANRCEGCLVVLADTYGVNQVRLGIERFG